VVGGDVGTHGVQEVGAVAGRGDFGLEGAEVGGGLGEEVAVAG
jgi:hypothetical protein